MCHCYCVGVADDPGCVVVIFVLSLYVLPVFHMLSVFILMPLVVVISSRIMLLLLLLLISTLLLLLLLLMMFTLFISLSII